MESTESTPCNYPKSYLPQLSRAALAGLTELEQLLIAIEFGEEGHRDLANGARVFHQPRGKRA